MAENAPDSTSCDFDAMAPFWQLDDDLTEGAEAMRRAGKKYLPQFEKERDEHYEDRRKNARYTNIYADIVENLAAKPFAEEVKLDDDADQRFKDLAADIDGRGNSIHGFAGETFHTGIRRAIDWILVDFTKAKKPTGADRPLSQAEEAQQGLRPYWVHIAATNMLWVESDVIGGQEIFTYAKYREDVRVREGYSETLKRRLRIFERLPVYAAGAIKPTSYLPATYRLLEEREDDGKKVWVEIDTGDVSIGEIALVPFITGRRKGSTWQFIPPMRGAADAQIEHYQLETALKWISAMTAFPMLAGNGVEPVKEGGKIQPVPVGPRAVLYAPAGQNGASSGEWKFIEPNGTSLNFLASQVEVTEQQLRELGRQPLTAQSGNLTVVTTAFAAQKGNSAIQAWALNLQTALERALALTAKWLKIDKAPTVRVFTDFALEMGDDQGPPTLNTARAAKDISRETYWEELKRRNILSADFDPAEEQNRLDAEAEESLSMAEDMAAAMTPQPDPNAPDQPPTDPKAKAPPPKPAPKAAATPKAA